MAVNLRTPLARLLSVAAFGAAALSAPIAAQTVTVFDNSTTSTFDAYIFSTSVGVISEIGDVITLGGTARLLTDVTVQFINIGASAGTFDTRISFYDYSAGPPVGGLLGSYSSTGNSIGAFAGGIGNVDIRNVTFSGLNLVVPNQLAFAVSVSNFGTLNLGLTVFDPPTIGSSDNDSLLFNGFNNAPPGLIETASKPDIGNLFFIAKATSS